MHTEGQPSGTPAGFDWVTLLSTFGGAGFFPVVPATFASVIVTLVLWVVGGLAWPYRVALLLIVTVTGVWAAGRSERRYGHDARCIVIDEVAGILLITLLIPWDLAHLTAAFFLFRILDVVKPPPAHQLQSLPGGWGIMADDLAAAAYGLLLLWVADLLIPFL